MTPTDIRSDELSGDVEQWLARYAEDAPSDHGLAERVVHRSRRRQRNRKLAVAAVAAAAVCANAGGLIPGPLTLGQYSAPAPSTRPAADPGWRWEAFGRVHVQVPESWGYARNGWTVCTLPTDQPGYVAHANNDVRTKCGRFDLPAPDRRRPAVWAGAADLRVNQNIFGDRADYVDGWRTETRTEAGVVPITVFSDNPDLRRRILASAVVFDDVDAFGCPVKHKFAARQTYRPDGEGLDRVGAVRSVSICSYYSVPIQLNKGDLQVSRLADGPAAQGIVDALLAAPAGRGPTPPKPCPPPGTTFAAEGPEVMVLVVRGAKHDQEVVVRYSGCALNGTDDGKTRRQLTREFAQRALTGSTAPWAHSAPVDALPR